MSSSQQTIEDLEGYLFAEDRQAFLDKLVEGSQSFMFFSLLHKINSSSTISSQVYERARDFKNYYPSTPSTMIYLRTLLERFDDPALTEPQKNSIIEELRVQYLYFQFNYSKPADITTSTLSSDKTQIPSTLNPQLVTLNDKLNDVYQNVYSFSQISPLAYTRLDTKKIAEADVQILERFLNGADPADFEDFPQLIISLIQKKKTGIEYASSFYDKLTREQLHTLGLLEPAYHRESQYVQTLCKKEFDARSLQDIGADLPKPEKREQMWELYQWAKKAKFPFPSLISSVLYEILQLDLEMNKFDKELFIEYLASPKNNYSYMTKKYLNVLHQKHPQERSLAFGSERIAQVELFKAYLEEFFKTAKDTDPFTQYLESTYLNDIFYSTKLMLGETLDVNQVLTPGQLKSLAESKEITICKYNKEFYKGSDPVALDIRIKNIPSLMIKVFEFKPENYYLKAKTQLDGSINLDGLVAAEEFNIDFNKEPPIKRFIHRLSLDSVSKKKQGIFIVDMIGNGLSSRAVIRKGKLTFIEQQTVAGQAFTLIDDETNICKGGRTGIWIKNRFYEADAQGKILIPFSSSRSEQAILIHNDFAELADIQLKGENFEFKCAYIYNFESFLMGNKAKILVQPRLFLNQQPVSMDVMTDCSAVVMTMNQDGIPSKSTFEKLKFSSAQDLELEFPIPAKLAKIAIQVKGQITPINKKDPVDYTSTHQVPVDTMPSSNTFCSLYLRYSKEGYQVLVLGKNGEPKPGITLQLSFQNKYLSQALIQSLKTDAEGRVSLGKLEEISSFTAEVQALGDIKSLKRSWNINSQKTANYPTRVCICKGDELALPLPSNELNRHKITFTQVLQNGIVVQNALKLLKIDKQRLIISGLNEGFYILHLKDLGKKITIVVLKGSYWSQSPNFLQTKDSLIDIRKDTNNIIISNIQVNPKANSSDLADITIQAYVDQPQLARFHVFGAQFMEANVNRVLEGMDGNLPPETPRVVRLGLKETQFLNNRSLGDEYCYVLDRRNKTRYMGNTLEKPPVLLKKTFVRETQTNEEQLSKTQEYSSAPMREQANLMDFDDFFVPPPKQNYAAAKCLTGNEDLFGFADVPSLTSHALTVQDNSPNFLANASLIYSNLKIDQQGTITIPDFPYKKYSLLQIIGSNLTSNICEIFPLDSTQVLTKDLRQNARAAESVFAINRASKGVHNGEKVQIKDLTSTEIQIIDSLPRLVDIQKNLVLSGPNAHVSYKFEQWDWIKAWKELSKGEKLTKYDKFASHELNLFVYFKDREFFNEVVLPFLRNKIEKSFVDYFLLDDKKYLQEFTTAHEFRNLNTLEQILVILSVQSTDPALATKLTKSLENQNSLNKADVNTFNRYFDTVLTSKKAEELTGKARDPYSNLAQAQSQARMSLTSYGAARKSQPEAEEDYDTGCGGLFGGDDGGGGGYYPSSGTQNLQSAQNEGMWCDDDDIDLLCDDAKPNLAKRAQIQAGFQELEKTKEYAERHYYEVGPQVYIPLSSFWVDLAQHITQHTGNKPFLSQNFIYTHTNLTEMIATLAFISLPFKPENHKQSSFEGRGLEIQAASDFITFTKAVTEAESNPKNDILITQRFFDPLQKYTESEEEPGVKVEKEVDQYIINKVYGSTVIITNSSSSSQQLQILVEIPEGAIPVNSLDYTKTHNCLISAFTTHIIEFFFYFPEVGTFKVNPPSVSKLGKVVAVGKRSEIPVKTEKTYTTLETLNAVLTKGSQEDVLNFARTKNIWNPKVFDFNSIYWLLKEKDFFLKFIEILRDRRCFDLKTWTFGFYHNDAQTVKEYFAVDTQNSVSSYFQYVDSSLINVDKLKLLEYHPYINQRVHLLADSKNRILNVQLKEQYEKFISYLCERDKLNTEHYLGLIYYLLLQDRVEEAIKFFGKIDREQVRKDQQKELQYDYFAAYLDFYMGYPKFTVAREICKKYLDYPVLSWRSLFLDVSNQLAEFDGQDTIEDETTKKTEKRQNKENAQKEEIAQLEIKDAQLQITHQNVRELTLFFYKIDLEVLFSRNPFITQGKDEFSYIQPSEIQKIQVQNPQDLQKRTVSIPQNLQKHNLHVELRAEDKTCSVTYFSTSLHVHILENYGQVKVLDSNDKPLIKVNFFFIFNDINFFKRLM